MQSKISMHDCLQAGRRAFAEHSLTLVLAWAIAAAVVVLFVILFPGNLTLGLQLGSIMSVPVLLWGQLKVLQTLRPDESGDWRLGSGFLDWGSAFLTGILIPTLFRYVTFYLWIAIPLSGGLMYTFVAWGIDDMFRAGRLDLFISAVLFGIGGFGAACGLFFAPLCAIENRKGPFDAIARSWRMAGGHRLRILGLATVCFGAPVLLFVPAYFISVLRTSGAVFQGLPALLWTVSIALTVLFLGPLFSSILVVLYIPLKKEEDEFMARRAKRKASSGSLGA